MNKPLLQALAGKIPERHPVWFLRQAGRYLPEYQKVREKYSFVELCHTPTAASEVTLQPLRRFDLDAAIIFSDILILPTMLGHDLRFDAGHGPRITPCVDENFDLRAWEAEVRLDTKTMGALCEAISLTKAKLGPRQTMIGFAGAPFTVGSYLVEGEGSKNHTKIKSLAFRHSSYFRRFLSLIAERTAEYLMLQVRAGAEAVMIFDSWAAAFAVPDYLDFVKDANALLLSRLADAKVATIFYSGQGSDILRHVLDLRANAFAIDWRADLGAAIERVKRQAPGKAIQGNLDPQVFLGSQEYLRDRVRSILGLCQGIPHIFNVGHGLLPHTSIENLGFCVDTIRSF